MPFDMVQETSITLEARKRLRSEERNLRAIRIEERRNEEAAVKARLLVGLANEQFASAARAGDLERRSQALKSLAMGNDCLRICERVAVELAQQIRAVEAAIENTKRILREARASAN